MQVFSNTELFNHINCEDYVSQNRLDRGYIYILLDVAFPDFCKIGKTQDLVKRIAMYNSDKPFPSAWIYAISKEFENSAEVEAAILRYLYSVTEPTTFRKEWFKKEYLPTIEMCLKEAESHFAHATT